MGLTPRFKEIQERMGFTGEVVGEYGMRFRDRNRI